MPVVAERTKKRRKVVSRAYHQAFDLHKPKKSDKDYVEKKLEMAKQAAREAHAAAAKKFDAEHPRGGVHGDGAVVFFQAIADVGTEEPEHDGEEGAEEESPMAVDPVVD